MKKNIEGGDLADWGKGMQVFLKNYFEARI